MPEPESIDNLDEAMVLGYFETLQSNFFLKLAVVVFLEKGPDKGVDSSKLPHELIDQVSRTFENPSFATAFFRGNREILMNLTEDATTAMIIGSWIVFEQIVKSLLHGNYAHSGDDIAMTFEANRFGLSDREKLDLHLFYYIRNAIVHYNGAYYTYRQINHRYRGIDFISAGNEGQKIIISPQLAFWMHSDIQQYALKLWNNFQRNGARADR